MEFSNSRLFQSWWVLSHAFVHGHPEFRQQHRPLSFCLRWKCFNPGCYNLRKDSCVWQKFGRQLAVTMFIFACYHHRWWSALFLSSNMGTDSFAVTISIAHPDTTVVHLHHCCLLHPHWACEWCGLWMWPVLEACFFVVLCQQKAVPALRRRSNKRLYPRATAEPRSSTSHPGPAGRGARVGPWRRSPIKYLTTWWRASRSWPTRLMSWGWWIWSEVAR